MVIWMLYPLAVFGVTYLLRSTDGPFDIIAKFRRLIRAQMRFIIQSESGASHISEVWSDTFFGKLFSCPWCLSTWVAAAIALLLVVLPYNPFTIWFILTCTGLGVSGFINSRLDKE